ncbi:hypothetical protein [Sorangium sp. So ce861]|uniref:hypothetical protein n=1 Tax=Sorangium sp. So ce861 TaxID=3133323 RepID=UPI003F6399FE
MRRWARRVANGMVMGSGAMAVVLATWAGGCGAQEAWDCPWDPVPGFKDHPCLVTEEPVDGGDGADACGDAGPDAGDTCADGDAGAEFDSATVPGLDTGTPAACPGQCVPREPFGWSEPALLWIGPQDRAPDCPAAAPIVAYEGRADFTAGASRPCPACLCDPPDASCELPAAWSTYAGFPCDVPGAAETPFAAPGGWDGACTSANAIAAGQMCDGALCAQSLEIPAPRVLPGSCAPRIAEGPEEPEEPEGAGSFAVFARACTGTAFAPCADPGMTCTPAPPAGDAAPPEGFLTCIHREGERDCPATYPDRHVFHAGAEDTRGCAPCGCAEPTGGTCSVLASAFSDEACSQLAVGVVVSSAAPFCGAISPGTALGSRSASVVRLEPGTCVPTGGEPIGGVALLGAATLCCRPAPIPDPVPA